MGLVLAIAAYPAFGQVTVSSPYNNEQVSSPFTLDMTATTCSSLPVTAVGYSLNNSTQTSSWNAQSIDGPVSAPDGSNTLHVKAWNDQGGVCVVDVTIDVDSSASSSGSVGATSVVPSSATSVSAIQALSGWNKIHDGGTPGSSSGTLSMTSSPSLSGAARLFANEFTDYGGERYWVQFSDDNTSENFFYDTWVYIAGSSSGFANLEFDTEQTMANGQTAVMGFQCDSWSGTWDYARNAGSAAKPNDTWGHSSASCNVHSWGVNQWHHVQVYYSRDTSGDVTYHSVWLDGAQQNIGVTTFSGFALGWGPAILTQFQVDGSSSGTTYANVYLDELTIKRW